MSVDKIARSLIKYSELIDKNVVKYKDNGVPIDVYLHYSSLMTTIIEMLVDKKVTQSMKDKAINSIKFLGINDTDHILHNSRGGNDAGSISQLMEHREGRVVKQIGDQFIDIEIKKDESTDTADSGCCVEYHLVGKIRKCFGEECKNLHFTQTNIEGRDFRDRIENWFYKTEAFKDLKRLFAKVINKYTSENKDEVMNQCIKIVKNKVIDIIQNNSEINEKLSKISDKLPTKPTPSFKVTEELDKMELNELIKDKKVESYMSALEKYAGNMIDIFQKVI